MKVHQTLFGVLNLVYTFYLAYQNQVRGTLSKKIVGCHTFLSWLILELMYQVDSFCWNPRHEICQGIKLCQWGDQEKNNRENN